MVELEWLEPANVLGARRGDIEELWRTVFPNTPDERFDEILPRHAERDGFRFLAARRPAGRLAGFAYGYRGRAGEWWHDRVAAAMTDTQREEWLGPGHFELVELMVAPELEGRGIGARLHDELLESVDAATAVLSTQQSNERALGFYARRAWKVLLPEIDFGKGYPAFCVLGKHLG